MPGKLIETIELPNRQEWRSWLAAHHDREAGVWLVFYKRHTGNPCISYEEAVNEALCFGWIDSIIRRLDDARYVRKFTPRKADSRWSARNRRRYAELKAQGLLAAPGLERPPTANKGEAPRPSVEKLPPYIEKALRADPAARANFIRLAPSCRRAYIGWVDSAKRPETKTRRLREALCLMAAGKKLGMK